MPFYISAVFPFKEVSRNDITECHKIIKQPRNCVSEIRYYYYTHYGFYKLNLYILFNWINVQTLYDES